MSLGLRVDFNTELTRYSKITDVSQASKNSKGIAGSVVVMLIAAATAAWFAYTVLFPQDVITFLVSIIYFPIAGIMIFVVYLRLKVKN